MLIKFNIRNIYQRLRKIARHFPQVDHKPDVILYFPGKLLILWDPCKGVPGFDIKGRNKMPQRWNGTFNFRIFSDLFHIFQKRH